MDERIQKYEEKMKKTLASLESELVDVYKRQIRKFPKIFSFREKKQQELKMVIK